MKDEIQEIKDYAFNLLSYRDRSSFELKERLIKKGYKQEDIEEVIARLEELSYIDDRSFAEKWIKYRIKHKPRGRNMLIKELHAKGVDSSLIDSALNKLFDEELETKTGVILAEKWLKTHNNDIDKLKRYLYNKGFPANIIYIVLAELDK